MAVLCPLCQRDILTTLDVPAEVGGAWICCICYNDAVQTEHDYYTVLECDAITVVDTSSDEADLCVHCGIELNAVCCQQNEGYCCVCFVVWDSDTSEADGRSEDEIDSSTEAPSDTEARLEEDLDSTSDYHRSEEEHTVVHDSERVPDQEHSLQPDDEDELKTVQESQPDQDCMEPSLKRSRF
jgi:hypothetical protein